MAAFSRFFLTFLVKGLQITGLMTTLLLAIARVKVQKLLAQQCGCSAAKFLVFPTRFAQWLGGEMLKQK